MTTIKLVKHRHHNAASTHASRLKTPAEILNINSLHRSAASMNVFCTSLSHVYLTDIV